MLSQAKRLAHGAESNYNRTMAYIPYVEYEDASQEVRALYDKFRGSDGMVAGYYAFVNRLAGGLGVELEHDE